MLLIVLAPRSSSAGTNNLPPLTFHQVHGDNISLCNSATIARRHESFCKGITFSARPVRVGEKVSWFYFIHLPSLFLRIYSFYLNIRGFDPYLKRTFA